ncbi:RINGv [Nesidiocoris tenuis]|uniref:RINGv n=1 Tax=Nesidiocoris tenuis TaxID=355587 RepID=A0ABN7ASS1_9HEMI|nr:RINGv [Nesidiocoris tenuis]
MRDNDSVQNSMHTASSDLSNCICRICQTAKSKEQLISPCNCKGTLGKVHLSCLEKWLNFCGRQHCEICKYHFQVTRTRRYGIAQSVRIWVRHPRHRIHLRSDLIIAMILTIITATLCCICAFGVRYFISEAVRLGIPAVYTEGIIFVFLAVIVLGYSVTMYLMCKDHVVPWYRWWTQNSMVKILIVDESAIKEVQQQQQPAKAPKKLAGIFQTAKRKELFTTCVASDDSTTSTAVPTPAAVQQNA